MSGALVLTLCSLLSVSSGQVFCPAKRAASCAAAAEAALITGEDEPLELMQVTASARRVGGIMGAAKAKQLPRADHLRQSQEERFSGVWMCQGSWATGAKTVQFRGGNLTMHDSCSMWKARLESDGIHVTEPEFAAGAICDISGDGFMLCNNGDNCSRLEYPLENLAAAEDYERYLGAWVTQDGGTGFDIGVADSGEFFYEDKAANVTGFVHLLDDDFWQADTCQDGHLAGAAIRMKLSKSGRNMMANIYLPGFSDWSPSIVHQRPGADKNGFPFTAVAIPLIILIFGVPASLFYFNMEGKPMGHHGEAIGKKKNIFQAAEGADDSDNEVAPPSQA